MLRTLFMICKCIVMYRINAGIYDTFEIDIIKQPTTNNKTRVPQRIWSQRRQLTFILFCFRCHRRWGVRIKKAFRVWWMGEYRRDRCLIVLWGEGWGERGEFESVYPRGETHNFLSFFRLGSISIESLFTITKRVNFVQINVSPSESTLY